MAVGLLSLTLVLFLISEIITLKSAPCDVTREGQRERMLIADKSVTRR
jgi:hypothetical protein